MYTGLRASVVVKPEWRAAIELLHRDRPNDHKYDSVWLQVFETYPDMPGVDRWVIYSRCDFIPFGALAYMPDDFSDADDRESYSRFDPTTGQWRFCCSLKNYKGEIQFFVENVLAHIVESAVYCESLYEQYPAEAVDDWRKWTTKHLRDREAVSGVVSG
jgi:hypothetical protein